MDIDDAVGEDVQQVFWHLGQEAGQDDIVASLHGAEHQLLVVVELLAGDNRGLHTEVLGTHDGVGVGA